MKHILLLVVLASAAWAQVTATLTAEKATVTAGEHVRLTLSLISFASPTMTDLQAELTVPSGVSIVATDLGASAAGAAKLRECNIARCVLYGLNNTALQGGPVLVYTIAARAPGKSTLQVSNIVGTTVSGAKILVPPTPVLEITVIQAKEDLNSDGKVDIIDVRIIVDQVIGLSLPTADQNGDGVVDIIDVRRIINAALQTVQ